MTTSNALFTTPFGHNTDFTELADNCQRYCEALVEETEPARKIALCGRLASTLVLLRPMLQEPLPEHLQERLTINVFPECEPAFNAESARVMGDLLFELTGYFADQLKVPRWLRTEAGVALLG
jgi:hypothetical protein